MNQKKPKYVKFIYRIKERLWLKVDKVEGNFIYGTLDSKPVSPSKKVGDEMKVNINKVVETKYK